MKLKKPFSLEKAVELYKSGLTLQQTASIIGISAPWLFCNLKPLGIVRRAGYNSKGVKRPYRPRPEKRTGQFLECRNCKKSFYIEKSQLNKAKFCSKPCYDNYQSSSLTDEENFWIKVAITDDDSCWEFTGFQNKTGYGSFKPRRQARTTLAHRFSWKITYGPIPHDLFVLHGCDNKICVRPDHLFLGTQRDNVRDAIQKGRFIFNPRAKLSFEKAQEIKVLYQSGNTARQIASVYNVSEGSIRTILSGRTWKKRMELIVC